MWTVDDRFQVIKNFSCLQILQENNRADLWPEIWIIFRCKVVRRGDSMRYCETLLYRFPTYNGPLKEMFIFTFLCIKLWKRPPERTFERLIHFHPARKIIGKAKNACLKLSYSRSVVLKLFYKIVWRKTWIKQT